MTWVRSSLSLALAGSCALPSMLVAQRKPALDTGTTPYILGTRIRLRSAVLGETREVIVTVPSSYSTGARKYPVVYVLDGSEYATIATAAVRSVGSSSRMPESIVVAIVNTDRERDFTPALRKTTELPPGIAHAGGADAFLAFMSRELLPMIDARYRTQPLRVLVGHSLGGLVAAHALATMPALFRRYVMIDPSLWWDAEASFAAVSRSFETHPDLRAAIAFVAPADNDFRELMSKAPSDVAGHFVPITEAHENMAYRGIYDGLLALFGDYVPEARHDESRATIGALTRQYAALTKSFGYQVPIPLSSYLEVANREANQGRFENAFAALDRATLAYPASSTIREWRAQIQSIADESAKSGSKAVTNAIPFSPASARDAERTRGEWTLHTAVEPGTPGDGEARFELRGDTLVLLEVAHHVAFDGGDYRVLPATVEIRGDSIRWERENRGGGHILVTGRFVTADRIVGEESMVGGHPMPPGFSPPKVTVVLERRR
jgi:predicted alpha/beta superfamily hydrolase